jgi:hypothetical protein
MGRRQDPEESIVGSAAGRRRGKKRGDPWRFTGARGAPFGVQAASRSTGDESTHCSVGARANRQIGV